ncbi:lysophospholipid acyltransferase family protein [Thermoflexus sp.]|uniref:lysophospholipid acyltransferase family protein n=1 Tax=Thermoflexus sp. TaxID=1969742 RepID=UPI0025EC4D05|nr:lysophospholipid acyltransferase family protein [Thermoflexus sp.]MCS6964806.1 lysophospholipid acyltransferase family protein [Thermoflexus sp.]MCX7690787.1 lysophospholipid acyltransferase family protein [Thermoflexus sp.]MDW8064093.1 lysophospholipid acyltransferase family protein [Anaerolineae bacterium]MDW8185221.1 lysophospholipid acyltransferase family protein [Anaerolineae bacterium]
MPDTGSEAVAWMVYGLFRGIGAVAQALPPRLAYDLAARLADFGYPLLPSAAGLRDNLAHVLGTSPEDPAAHQAARRAFRLLWRNYVDLFQAPRRHPSRWFPSIRIEGWEHLEEAWRTGNGVIAASAHYGPLEWGLQFLGASGLPALAVAEPVRPPAMFRYLCRLRGTHGLRLIPADGALREVFRTLQQGGIVALALDRDITGSGRVYSFFGEDAWLPDGYAELAVRRGIPVVPAFARREGEGVRLQIWPPLWPAGKSGEARETLVAQALEIFAGVLQEAPDQWVLTTPIWRIPSQRVGRVD